MVRKEFTEESGQGSFPPFARSFVRDIAQKKALLSAGYSVAVFIKALRRFSGFPPELINGPRCTLANRPQVPNVSIIGSLRPVPYPKDHG
jgi:hypothetical protein